MPVGCSLRVANPQTHGRCRKAQSRPPTHVLATRGRGRLKIPFTQKRTSWLKFLRLSACVLDVKNRCNHLSVLAEGVPNTALEVVTRHITLKLMGERNIERATEGEMLLRNARAIGSDSTGRKIPKKSANPIRNTWKITGRKSLRETESGKQPILKKLARKPNPITTRILRATEPNQESI